MSTFDSLKTSCPRGHPYDAKNTLVTPRGKRVCRACRNERGRRRKAGLPPLPRVDYRTDPAVRFFANVERRPDSECWWWTGYTYSRGYASFNGGTGKVPAHRWSYEPVTREVNLASRTRSETAKEHSMTTSPSTAADFLMGASSPSAKFPTPGTTVGGTITRVGDPIQQRDMATGKPKLWDDGSPQLQLPVDVATDARDPDIPNDDGTRTLYIKGGMKKAITDAVRAAGAKMLEVGGTLTVTYASDGTPSQKGFNPPKVYTATYAPPTNAAAAAFLGADEPADTTTPAAPAVTPGQTVDINSLPPEVRALLEKVAQPATG